ncbi:MAG TPA: M14 family metallopeptidase [Gemmatimonadales bacterium]|nr:M14 family metallopeptidase [Gemmatimonadales bacterium]
MMHRATLLIAAASLATLPLAAQQTVAERTGAANTSTHADVIAFIDSLEARGARLHVGVLGTSPQGREIQWLVASRPLVTTPGEARRSGKPVFYIQANIHGGEVEGKEAMQRLLRDLTIGDLQPLLDSVIILAVPVYNTDGNDNLGPAARHRPGQNGPDPVGLRPNGQGFDLNRDYIKQEAPETRASLALIAEWDPDVFMDLHTSNGSYHGYALTWSPGLSPIRTPVNSWVQDTALPAIGKRIMARHGFRTFPYGNFANQDPDSIGNLGWLTYESVPRFGTNLMGISRVSLLSEAYSNDPFARRIDVTWAFVLESIRWFNEQHAAMQDRIERTIALRPDSVPVRSTFAPPRRDTVIFEVTSSAGQGSGGYARRQRSGEFRTQVMPVVDRFVPTRKEVRPAAYLLDAQWSEVVERMVRQGIAVERIDVPWTGQSSRFRIDSIAVLRPFEGHRAVRVDGNWEVPAADSLPAGGYLISTDQRLGTLAAFLLEPASEDGYTNWNFFDRALRTRGFHPVRKVAELPAVPRTRVR